MNPLFEGPLGPQRLEHLNIAEFPTYQRFVAELFPTVSKAHASAAQKIIDGECVEIPDPRTDLIHPFTD